MHNNSQGKKKEVEDHRRSVKLSKNKTSVTACIPLCQILRCLLILLQLIEIILFIVLLINFVEKFLGTVKFGNDQIAPILGYRDLVQGAVTIKRVYYVEELNHNLFSVDQFCDADLEVAFRKSTCFIRDLKGNDLLTGSPGMDFYSITLHDTNSPNPICLMAMATSSQAWLWHRRLSHLNFNTINLLSKNDIVVGLPKLKFVNDHLCSSCKLGKAKRKSFKTKLTPSSKRRLHLLHMDLCGPMRVASINGKKYVLVIVDDYSRYTWTHFLRSKDETPEVLIDFLRIVQRGLQAQGRVVRTDKGTEFLNQTLHAYFAAEGIQHQTSVARTPEQNGVAERRNRTLVEAARTMLSAAKVLLFFWAEEITTACFTQNRSLVIPRHEKTPYHIINDQKPSVKFFHIFGSVCYIVRDGEDLDKMKEKGDECIFVGYSTQSRAYKVFNKRTRVIMESIHVNFDELSQMASAHNSSDPAPICQTMASAHNSSDPTPTCQTMASVQISVDPAPECQTMASAHNSSDPTPTCQTMASVQISVDPAPECQTMALEHNSLSLRRKCQENVSHRDKTGTTSNELDLLFSPMFDELLNGSSKVVSKSSDVSAAAAPNQRQQPTTPLNNHTTPAPSCQTPTIATSVISSENINQAEPHAENDQVTDDEFINIFSTPRWTKDHPLEQVIGNPSQSVRTRRQLESDTEMCMFALTTLHAYFAAEGIQHQTSAARTPEQNGVVERRNRTLVEAARTMLSAAKVPLFFWAEAIATACFTQNRSLVIPRHEKTPYHIINERKPSVKFFHIFGFVCYIVRDNENLDKMKEKGDECIFVGYSTQSRAYRVFNKRTRVIMEFIHVNFDELPHMTSVHISSDPAPTCQSMASVQISSDPAPECQTMALEHNSLSLGRICQENVSHVDKTGTTSNELDLLFSLMFDELLNGSTKVVSKSFVVSTADA
nr:retrovirus-related Pol polyprotein from transposon TNT 1-94 [Tanacetum cinerariifolium]